LHRAPEFLEAEVLEVSKINDIAMHVPFESLREHEDFLTTKNH